MWLAAPVGAFGMWVFFNVLAFLIGARFPPDCPCYTGFRVVMPAWLDDILTPDEIEAVLAHEQGHQHHAHVWRNLAAKCVFLPVDRLAQEHQADDYAASGGHAGALASALAKISTHPQDLARAARLLA